MKWFRLHFLYLYIYTYITPSAWGRWCILRVLCWFLKVFLRPTRWLSSPRFLGRQVSASENYVRSERPWMVGKATLGDFTYKNTLSKVGGETIFFPPQKWRNPLAAHLGWVKVHTVFFCDVRKTFENKNPNFKILFWYCIFVRTSILGDIWKVFVWMVGNWSVVISKPTIFSQKVVDPVHGKKSSKSWGW